MGVLIAAMPDNGTGNTDEATFAGHTQHGPVSALRTRTSVAGLGMRGYWKPSRSACGWKIPTIHQRLGRADR
jgi:hypothetical protein